MRWIVENRQLRLIELLQQPIKKEEPILVEPTMQIFLRLLTGQTVTLDVDPSYTIRQVKSLALQKLKTPNMPLKLSYASKNIHNDNLTLAQLNVRSLWFD